MKPFTSTLAELRGGQLNEELADALRLVTAAVRKTGRKGKVTLTLTVKPATKGDIDRLSIKDKVEFDEPTLDIPETFLFADDRNDLSKQDPQQKLFGQIAKPPAEAPIASPPPEA
jgi:hypothetical protein